MSPVAAMNVAAQITFTPGTVISRLISGEPSTSVAIKRSTASTGRSSGIAVDMSLVHVWTLSGDLAIRCETFDDSAEALKAVGLRQ
jgi:hypothetical protein